MRHTDRMRTTVNLEPDVVAAVEDLRRRRHMGLSEALNELARAGLRDREHREPFRQRSYPMGAKVDVSNIGDVLDLLDEA